MTLRTHLRTFARGAGRIAILLAVFLGISVLYELAPAVVVLGILLLVYLIGDC